MSNKFETSARLNQIIRESFDYNSETGRLRWRVRPIHHFKNLRGRLTFNERYSGTEVCTVSAVGYVKLKIAGRQWSAHRIAWFIEKGEWPLGILDHINGDRSDNRICNLRDATAAQNAWNATTVGCGASGVRGVRKRTASEKWEATIRKNGKTFYLGVFDTLADAAAARRRAELTLYGEFAPIESASHAAAAMAG